MCLAFNSKVVDNRSLAAGWLTLGLGQRTRVNYSYSIR